ncbi:hypothetical protein [Arthrobacter sp. USHLN218]|uniref:hypothetical protein n=1 Tax=Arthrobacter sp. USHLN218 TaxID=3081232 RepID=UPI0030166214
MPKFTPPAKMRDLIEALIDNQWAFAVTHGTDTGGSPFATVEGRTEKHHIVATWHTRVAGTYRLFSALHNKRDATLMQILHIVNGATDA